jgi:hypothetical protein
LEMPRRCAMTTAVALESECVCVFCVHARVYMLT